jgi:CubicO group peptidase (beta-lactamase class C family)
MYKNAFYVVLLLLIICAKTNAQTTPLEQSTHRMAVKAIDILNKKMPDSLYPLAGEQLRKMISPAVWSSLFKNDVLPLLPLKDLTFQSSTDSINKYLVQGTIPLNLYFSLDKSGKIKDMNFQPYIQARVASEMNAEDRKTDLVAQKFMRLINEKKSDSVYLLTGEKFRQQFNAEAWNQVLDKNIYPLTPLKEFIFVGSNQTVNRYKSGTLQFLIGLDKQSKVETFRVQAYQDIVPDKAFKSDNALKNKVDSALNAPLSTYMRNKGNVGLSVGVYYAGKDYYYNYGETKLGNATLPGNRTLYDIGSITKTFTATLLALAVNEGKVTLTSPIISFLPDSVASNPALKDITLMQLSNHTSGLPRLPSNLEGSVTDSSQPYANYNTKLLFSFLKDFKTIRPAGTKYEYSNMAVGLLGVILEKVYKKPYAELVATFIAKPANMTQTQLVVKTADTALIAQGYNENITAVAPWKFKAMEGAGGIKSATSDMLKYGKLQLNGSSTPLSKAIKLTHEITYKEDQNTLGLGWHFLNGNSNLPQHGGATGGYRSILCADLEQNIVVVVLTNNSSTGDALGFEVLKVLQKLK